MRILMDGFWLDKPRGLGRYVREALHALAANAQADVTIEVLVHDRIDEKYFVRQDRIIYIRKKWKPHPFWEQFTLPWEIRKRSPEVVHCPYNTAPIVRTNAKYCVTIHDLIFNENLGSGLRQNVGNLYRRLICKSFSYHNQKIITVSQASADMIRKTLKRPATVIYTPTETFGLQNSGNSSSETKDEVILHVGGKAPHKNTERVIAAYKKLGTNVPLIVLGLDAEDQLAKRHQSRNVVFPGWIDDHEVMILYRRAILLVFPSLMEGYGLPIVEAFTAGVPVLTSNRPPMSEVAAGAALLVNPEDVDGLAAGMRSIVSSAEFSNKLKKAGKLKLEKINGRSMCEGLLACYSAAIRGNNEKGTSVDYSLPNSSE